MTDLTPYLVNEESFKNLVAGLDAYFRAQRWAELDTMLRGYMTANPSPITQICAGIAADSCHFTPENWADLHRGIVSFSEGQDKVAAIGFDLTGHWDGTGPGFEISFYGDDLGSGFKFSEHAHHSLLEKAKYPAPWQGNFIQCENFGPIKGLERLFDALRDYGSRDWYPSKYSKEMPEGFVGYFLGLMFLHLRVQETFARELAHYGLPRPMPVLFGTHDFMGIFYDAYNVQMCATMARDVISYEQITDERRTERQANAKTYAASQIEEMTKTWMSLRAMRAGAKNQTAKKASEFLDGSMKFKLGMSDITPTKPIAKMSEAEFKALMERYYVARMNKAAA